jgi:HSP20 family protein|tara:strand:- start:2615 stop:3037 length:423 start_codon:yes stop_codon:yes gene_type:complete
MNLIKTQSSFLPFIFDEFLKNNWNINVPNNSYSYPSTNIKENDKEFVLELAMPGKCNKDFNIEIENRILNISTLNDNQTSEYNYNIQEFNYSSFNKSYDLPESIDLEKVDSLYRNGILSITLPKRKEYQSIPKKIISVKK